MSAPGPAWLRFGPPRALLVVLLLAGCGSGPAIRYLALGDSFTAGTGSRPDQAFPARLAGALRAAGHTVALENVAVNGFTSADVLAREVPALAAFHPTDVTLAVGANDIVRGVDPEAFRGNVRAIVRAIVAAGVVPRRIVGLPQPEWPRAPVGARFGASLATLRRFDAILRAEIEAAGGLWAPLEARMTEEASAGAWAGDGLHPDAGCHEAWAEALLPVLTPR